MTLVVQAQTTPEMRSLHEALKWLLWVVMAVVASIVMTPHWVAPVALAILLLTRACLFILREMCIDEVGPQVQDLQARFMRGEETDNGR